MNIVKRGEIYWINWNPSRGSDQSGVSPSLVVQNDTGNQYSPTTIVAVITTAHEKNYPFLVRITAEESGLPGNSAVNLSVIMTVDKTRLTSKCGELSEKRMDDIDEALKVSLGLKR